MAEPIDSAIKYSAYASHIMGKSPIYKCKSIPYDYVGNELSMPENSNWEDRAKGLLKSEIKRRNLTYAQLVVKLAEIGVHEEERNLRNKVARGKFTAAFLVQCLNAMGVRVLHLNHDGDR